MTKTLEAGLRELVASLETERDEARRFHSDEHRSRLVAEAERDAALVQVEALRPFAEGFAETAEAAVRHAEVPDGGQRAPFHGDFANVPPCTIWRLRRWAQAARASLSSTPAPERGIDQSNMEAVKAEVDTQQAAELDRYLGTHPDAEEKPCHKPGVQRCTCEERCLACDEGVEVANCTCLKTCPIHNPAPAVYTREQDTRAEVVTTVGNATVTVKADSTDEAMALAKRVRALGHPGAEEKP